jgi:hypothetical protein
MDPKEAKHEDNPQLDILIEQVDNVAKLLEASIKQKHDTDSETQFDAMIIEMKNLSQNVLKYIEIASTEKPEKEQEEKLIPSLDKIETVLRSILDHEMTPEKKDDSMMKHHEAMMSVLSDIKTILSTPEQENEGPEDVKVIGEVDIKKPKWYESFMYDEMAIRIKEVFSGITLKVKSDKPLDVRMVDDKGNPIGDLGGGKTIFAGSNAPEVVGVKNKSGQQVNLLTEDIFSSYFKTLIDKTSTTVIYIGKASIGSNTSAASWQITKIDLSTSVISFLWADGNTNFDNVWDNRSSLTYS